MQHLRVNFGGLNLVSFCFLKIILLKKSRLIFNSPVATLHCCPPIAYTICSVRINVQCQYVSVFIRDHVMHSNTSVNSVNEHY